MRHLPNLITLGNLFLGCCAFVCIINGNYLLGVALSLVCGIADLLDGALARAMKVNSPLGKELDSLADVISFGAVPAAVFYVILENAFPLDSTAGLNIYAVPAFLVAAMSGYRLAKFNLDTRQEERFLGLPTPANTLFALGLLLIFYYDSFGLREYLLLPAVIYGMIPVFSWLLISEIPMFSLKMKQFSWVGNEIRFIFAAIVIIELILFREASLAVIILTYILISVFQYLFSKEKESL